MEVTDAVAWPFAIGGQVTELMDWLTDSMIPPYGPPQNRKLRQCPRTTFQFDGLESADNRRWMETLLNSNGAGLWHAPVATDAVPLAADAAAGATTLLAPTAHRRFYAGGNAMLVGANIRNHQVVEIDSVSADGITLVDPLASAWSAGAMLTPTIGARLTEAPSLARFTGDTVPYSVSFRAEEPMDWPADFGAAVYRTYPVYELPIDWSAAPTYVPERKLEQLDNGVGPIKVYDLAGMVLPTIGFQLAAIDRPSIGKLRGLLSALSGRWSPVWVPTFGQDIRLQSVFSSTAIDVAWFGYSAWPIKGNRRDIRVQCHNRPTFYRRISSAAAVSAATERLLLGESLPVGFQVSDVVCISFMALCCQDTDTNSLRLWSYDVMQCNLAFRGINNDF